MSAPPHPEFAGLMADILAHPASDTPRLVCADWLEEHGQPEHAEFIRVQCEMELLRLACNCGSCVSRRWGGQHHNGPCALDDREHRHLKVRERQLLYEYMVPYSDEEGRAGQMQASHFWAPRCLRSSGATWEFRRGFVAAVTAIIADWRQLGPTLVRQCPLDRVVAFDCKPVRVHSGYAVRWWRGGGGFNQVADVPADLFDCLPSGEHGNPGLARTCKEYASYNEGVKALSEGCILWAKKQPVPDGGHQEDVPF